MFRFNRVVCFLLVCSVPGLALGEGAVKIKTFTPVLTGESENPEIDGMVVANHDNGQGTSSSGVSHVNVTVTDLQPETAYRAWVTGGHGGGSLNLTTNKAGIAHAGTEFTNDVTTDFDGNPFNIHVYIFIDFDGDFNVAPDEIRGIACITEPCDLPLSFTPCTQDSECALPQHPCLDTSCVLDYCKAVWRDCPPDGDVCTSDMCQPVNGERTCPYTSIYNPDIGCNPF